LDTPLNSLFKKYSPTMEHIHPPTPMFLYP